MVFLSSLLSPCPACTLWAMFVRRVAVLLWIAIGVLPTVADASTPILTRAPVSRPVVAYRPPIMSVAERLKEDSFCHHSEQPTTALLPHSVADMTPPARLGFLLQRKDANVIHPQTGVSHAPQLPASNRIRAPSV
jgi:hypothetical protein